MASSLKVSVVAALAALTFTGLLTGCGSDPGSAVKTKLAETEESAAVPEIEEAQSLSIEDVDFTSLDWSLSETGRMIPVRGLSFANGPAKIGTIEHTIVEDQIVYGESDGDGEVDAIVPVHAIDTVSDGIDLGTVWYLWASYESTGTQILVPAAVSNCDTVVESVVTLEHGFEITAFQLRSGEETYTACGEPGSDKRTRTITIAETGPIEDWQLFSEGYPGWKLVGANIDGNSGCTWTKI